MSRGLEALDMVRYLVRVPIQFDLHWEALIARKSAFRDLLQRRSFNIVLIQNTLDPANASCHEPKGFKEFPLHKRCRYAKRSSRAVANLELFPVRRHHDLKRGQRLSCISSAWIHAGNTTRWVHTVRARRRPPKWGSSRFPNCSDRPHR